MAKRTNRVAWGLVAVLAVLGLLRIQLASGFNVGFFLNSSGFGFIGVRLLPSGSFSVGVGP